MDPDPGRADESERTHAETIAFLESMVKLAASAFQRTLADIQDKS